MDMILLHVDVDVDDNDDIQDDDDIKDLYIIGAVCLCVCMLRKGTTFRIQKILSFLLFIASFRTQRNWSFPCFLTLL